MQMSRDITMAERVGFEPTEACTSHAFEACPFGRSGTSPPARLTAIRFGHDSTGRPDRVISPLKSGSSWSDTLSDGSFWMTGRFAEPHPTCQNRRQGEDSVTADLHTPTEHVFKLLVTGPFAAGKTSLIQSVSHTPVVETDVDTSGGEALVKAGTPPSPWISVPTSPRPETFGC